MKTHFATLTVLASLACIAAAHAAERDKSEPPPKSSQLAPTDPAALAAFLEKSYEGAKLPEAARMLADILRGRGVGPGEGWFGPADTRYTWMWLAKLHGIDPKTGAIPKDKFRGSPELFARLDRNKDGSIDPEDLDWSDSSPWVQMAGMLNRVFRRMDQKGQSKLTREQWDAFFDKASGGKDHLTSDDFRDAILAGYSSSFTPGDAPNPAVLIRGLFAGEIGSLQEGPRLNQPAPNFTLKRQDGKGTIELSQLIGKKPVVLVLGNFTCGPFRAYYPGVEQVYERHKDRANFLMVYVREAHPTDGWKMESNTRVGVAIKQPKTFEERVDAAGQFCTKLKPKLPVVVDEISDPVGHAYSGMPARLYVIDSQGKIAYKSGRGPFGFKAGEMEQALMMCLLEAESSGKQGRIPLLSNEDAWAKLPEVEAGAKGQLPGWARALAGALPRTTAGMLELDRVYRTSGLADAKLRAMARWSAAHANKSPYGEAYALADLRRAGATDKEIAALTSEDFPFPEPTRRVLTFAKKLTLHAYKVTDAEVARLKEDLGEKQLVALVQLLAYANFQDRLVLTLGLEVEPGGPLPPLDVHFKQPWVGGEAPTRPTVASKPEKAAAKRIADPEWLAADYSKLQANMELQRERPGRVSVPSFEEVSKFLPGRPTSQPLKIRWSLVCIGHSPELANAWLSTMRTFGSESKQDRVFEECLFWVVTRTLQCFY